MKKDLEWLKKEVWAMNRNGGFFWKDKVMDLIDQFEQPEIPDYVEKYKEDAIKLGMDLNDILIMAEKSFIPYPYVGNARKWINKNKDLFIKEWHRSTGEEKKYRVIVRTSGGGFLYMAKCMFTGDVRTNASVDDMLIDSDRFNLTEKEIKDYDERFWSFAKLVEGDLQ